MRSINRVLCSSVMVLAVAGCHDSTAPGDGGSPLPPGLTLKLDPFIPSGLASPVFLAQPLNDGLIFVVEQAGRIRVIRNGTLQTTPFLDISSKVLSGGERGLLSVAFHPQYATNHFLYVYFTTQTNGDIRIERFTTTMNPEVADPATSTLILTAPHSQYNNHNGGLVVFGPDGMLYAGLGDGGSGGDPLGNGQNYNALLGSLLRLDVNRASPYIPPDNPFVGQTNRRGEVWAKGLRNPWRYAFDAPTGLLYIADVGQSAREEVDVVPVSQAGLNYGWNVREGASCYRRSRRVPKQDLRHQFSTTRTLALRARARSPGDTCTGGQPFPQFAVITSMRTIAWDTSGASGTRTEPRWIRRIGASQ